MEGGGKSKTGLSGAPEAGDQGEAGGAAARGSHPWTGRGEHAAIGNVDGGTDGQCREAAARELLARRHGLRSEFIGVGALSKILGIAPATIYGHMRAGRFFLPYRLFNISPMVCLDDLARWYCSHEGVVPAFGAKPERKPAWMRDDEDATGREEGRGLTKAEVNAEIEKAAAASKRALGLDPSKKRRVNRRPK